MLITSYQVQKIITEKYNFQTLGFSLLVTRLKNMYSDQPVPEALTFCEDEINKFVSKHSRIMGSDLAIISEIKG